MTLHCNQVAASALALHFVLSSAVHHSLSFVGSGPATGTAPYPTPPSWRCRPSRLVVPASLRPESPAEQKKSPAGGSPTDKTPTAQDEDERQTERWGVAPTASPSKSRKPLEAVRSSIRAVGDGVSSAKDAVYEVVDAAGTLIESSQRGIQGAMAEGETPSSPSGADSDSANRVMPLSKGNPKRSGDKEGWGAVLKAVGGGAVFVKDALWGSVELLGEAAESAKQAPETARNAVEGSKAALECEWPSSSRFNLRSTVFLVTVFSAAFQIESRRGKGKVAIEAADKERWGQASPRLILLNVAANLRQMPSAV